MQKPCLHAYLKEQAMLVATLAGAVPVDERFVHQCRFV